MGKLSISNSDYHELKSKIRELIIRSETKLAGDNDIQIRWNLYHEAALKDKYILSSRLYEYLNDDNIDSALKKIMAELHDEDII